MTCGILLRDSIACHTMRRLRHSFARGGRANGRGMAIRREFRYEVVVEQGGKPNIDGIFDDETAARERAAYLLRLAKFPVVRVVKVNHAGREEVIFQKAAAGGGSNTTISPIEQAEPACAHVLQVFGFESRMTLLRLLRGYWDEQGVIPAEQLHRYFPLRYFEREALLFNPGISRLATLQAPKLGMKVFDRQDELLRMFNSLKELAQASESLAPFRQALARGGLSGLLAAAAAAERPPEERDRVITYAVGAALEPYRDWRAKLAALLRFQNEDDEAASALLDEFLCETVDGREPVRALIGYAPDLGAALLSLLATVHGDLDDRLPFTDELMALAGAVGSGLYPRTKEALLRRVEGGLNGRVPLTRTGQATEGKAFESLVDRLAAFDGYMGGPTMAEALTRRAKVAWGVDGQDLSFEATVRRLARRLTTPAQRIGYLLDLATSGFGRHKLSVLIPQVADEFDRIESAHELTAPGVSVEEMRNGLGRRLRAAGIPRALADGLVAKMTAVPDDRRLAAPAPALIAANRAPRGLSASPAPCAATMIVGAPRAPSRLLLTHGSRTLVIPDDGAELVIGRSSQCQLVLSVASASRRHATVAWRDGVFVVEDLSRNGTRVVVPGVAPRQLEQGQTVNLPPRGELHIGSTELGEEPARIAWEIR